MEMDYQKVTDVSAMCNGKTVSELNCRNGFAELSIETKKANVQRINETSRKEAEDESRLPILEAAYTTILQGLGENTDRQGLLRTPLRAAKAMQFLTKGYHETIYGEITDLLGWRKVFDSHFDKHCVCCETLMLTLCTEDFFQISSCKLCCNYQSD